MTRMRLSGVVAIDKDVVINAYLKLNPEYRDVCKDILLDGFSGLYTPVITNQILYELLEELISRYRVDEEIVKIIVNGIIMSEHWMKVNYTFKTVERAREIQSLYGLSLSTSLLIATLEEYSIKKIVSGRGDLVIYPYIEVVNPFKK